MKTMLNLSLRGVTALALAAGSMTANAWPRSHAKSNDSVQVVSGVSFEGKPAADMSLEQEGGKSYLQVHFRGGETRIIDVTHPDKLVDADRATVSKNVRSTDESVKMAGLNASVSAEHNATSEFTLWDISRPGNPRLVQIFTGVNRVVEDQRSYIYVLYREGVSIVHCKGKDTSKPDLSIYG